MHFVGNSDEEINILKLLILYKNTCEFMLNKTFWNTFTGRADIKKLG